MASAQPYLVTRIAPAALAKVKLSFKSFPSLKIAFKKVAAKASPEP